MSDDSLNATLTTSRSPLCLSPLFVSVISVNSVLNCISHPRSIQLYRT
jgi:hypothetical protein